MNDCQMGIADSVYFYVLIGLITGFAILYSYKDYFFISNAFKLFYQCVLFSVFSVISVLLFAVFEQVITGHRVVFGAVSTYGVYLFCPIFIFLIFHKDRKIVFDLFALYVLPSLFFQRIRCITNGCCIGKLIGINDYRWPTRESEMLFYIVMLLFFIRKKKHKDLKTGEMFPILMIAYGILRFVEEFFREGNGVIHLAHLWSILSIIIGYCLYLEFRPHN